MRYIRFSLTCALALFITGCGPEQKAQSVIDATMDRLTIYEAAEAGDLESVREFISSNNWDPSVPDGKGVTVLNYAASSGNIDLIMLVVLNGANVNQQDVHRKTPLMRAREAGHDEAVELLLNLGASE